MAQFRPWQDKSFLYQEYVVKRKTIYQIAEECTANGHPTTHMTIYNNLKKHGLLKNSRNLGKRSVGGNAASRKKKGFY
mgnify:FL=1